MRIELCKAEYHSVPLRQKLEKLCLRGKAVPGWLTLCFGVGIVTGLWSAGRLTPARSNPPIIAHLSTGHSPAKQHQLGTKGPWGDLEYTRILLEPDELYQDPEKRPPAQWYFQGYAPAQLKAFFDTCDLTPGQRTFLLDTHRWLTLTNGLALTPTDELLLGLSHEACQKIYSVLARSPENDAQNFPFRFPLDGFDERFANCGLNVEKIQLIRAQTYANAGWLCFSSLHPMHRTFSAAEFHCLKRALYKIPTLRVRLRITPDSDIDSLLKYWAQGGREKAVRPILESLARDTDGETIGIGRFLPPFARLRLFTYPDPYADPMVAKEDCFYTALNFFNEQPDARFLDHRLIREILSTQYYEPVDEPAFGDLFVLMDSGNSALHACIYVADDVVFTKNGVGYLEPWVFMKMADVLADYPNEKPLHLVHFRRRDQNFPGSNSGLPRNPKLHTSNTETPANS